MFRHRAAKSAVGRHATGDRHRRHARQPHGLFKTDDQSLHHRGLKRSAEVLQRDRFALLAQAVHLIDRRRFQAAETEIQPVQMVHHVGKTERVRVARNGQTVDDRAAGIGQAEHLGHFVEGLAGRVVLRGAEHFIFAAAPDEHDFGVTAGNDHAQKGKLQIFVIDHVSVDVPFQMIDAENGNVPRLRVRLGRHHADQQRAHQPGAARHRHEADLFRGIGDAGFFEHGLRQRQNRFQMHARGVLRDDAAKRRVSFDLAGDLPTEDAPRPCEQRHRRVVAAAFDPQRQKNFL